MVHETVHVYFVFRFFTLVVIWCSEMNCVQKIKLILGDDGNRIIDPQTGGILCENEQGETFYATLDPLPPDGATEAEVIVAAPQPEAADAAGATGNNKNIKAKWSKTEIRKLISLCKENKPKFSSTTVKNSEVYASIAEHFPTKTTQQVIDKWKYLKLKYTEAKDSRGPRNSGGVRINFEFFDDMDDVLGRDHNITPPVIASSSRGTVNVPSTSAAAEAEIFEEEIDDPAPPAQKRAKVDKWQKKEEAIQKRHEERMAMQKDFIAALNRIADNLKPPSSATDPSL